MRRLLILFVAVLASCSKDDKEYTPPVVKIPVLSSREASDVAVDMAYSGGTVTSSGGGTITARGVVWGTATNPTVALSTKTQNGTGLGDFTSTINGLAANTKYFYRAYATNSAGTAYGNQNVFTTHIATDPVIDADGNVYETIQIGTQLWMKENLKTTKYCNGDDIPNVISDNDWFNLNTGAWSYYQNDSSNNAMYGKLYNWYAMKDTRNVCPCGWHVPTPTDWDVLVHFLGGAEVAGKKMKATSNWIQTLEATNASGFTGLPAGLRTYANTVVYFGWDSAWWVDDPSRSAKLLHYNSPWLLNVVFDREVGVSIRCVKD